MLAPVLGLVRAYVVVAAAVVVAVACGSLAARDAVLENATVAGLARY